MTDAADTRTVPTRARMAAAVLLVALASLTTLAAPVVAQEESAAPEASPTAAEALCTSASDLAVIIDFIRSSVEAEAGLISVGVGVIAAVSEARRLVGLVGETYRPLVEDLVLSLQGLRDTIGALEELETAGAKVASVGEAITDIGNAMDSLSVQLRTRCASE